MKEFEELGATAQRTCSPTGASGFTIVIVSPVTRRAVRDYQIWVQQHNVLAYQQVQAVSTIVIVSPVTRRAV